MTTTQEVTAEALIEELLDAQQDVNLAANSYMDQSLCNVSELMSKLEEAMRQSIKDTPKIAQLTTDRDHWQRQAADTVASNNRLVERARAAEADNARLREVLINPTCMCGHPYSEHAVSQGFTSFGACGDYHGPIPRKEFAARAALQEKV